MIKRNKLKLFTVITACILGIACINTSYSKKHERLITNDLADLILGQFAHHGPAFYKQELTRTEKVLKEKPTDLDASNDKAAALLKLKRYEEAEKLFLQIDKQYPKQYKVNSNLGVLYKKMERYDEAAIKINKALTIKPGGHMGLGDYYLRMLKWRATNKQQLAKDPKFIQQKNFLDVAYADGPDALYNSNIVNKKFIITLIKNDIAFADSYLILGDILFIEKDHEMAMRAYYRALSLDHKAKDIILARINDIRQHWQKTGYIAVASKSHVNTEITAAKEWLDNFQKLEETELAKDPAITYGQILKKADRKPTVSNIGYQEAPTSYSVSSSSPAMYIAIGAVVILLFFSSVLAYIFLKPKKRRASNR